MGDRADLVVYQSYLPISRSMKCSKCYSSFGQSFTLFCLAWGGLTQGRGFDLSNQTAYLDGTLRWGLDWLIKAHPEDDVLFVQVGDQDIDDDYW